MLAAAALALVANASLAPVRPAIAAATTARVHHSLRLTLDPARHWLQAEDTLTVAAPGSAVEFLLNGALKVTASQPIVTELPFGAGAPARFFGINGTSPLHAAGQLRRYRAVLPAGVRSVRVVYEGRFDFGLSDEREQYSRGFRETAGIVSPEGVYLSGSGFFHPHVDSGLVEFELEVVLPRGWHVISPGSGRSRDERGVARWESRGPVDEITVAGGPLIPYRAAAGSVEALVYLRGPDDALASRYLEATRRYLELYRTLVGPYPYGKFALVENFWETGYGMPSFTLLGPQVIRLPFILTSSYPHEILHNWWGNSVFVDYETGNWCEGLTAYMADHLIQEQRGVGEEYRRDTLAKYRSYVRDHPGRDFPLREFRSRHSAATEAVGYGKALMLFHMLRRRLGDDAFARWTAGFYREQRGRKASFDDVRRSLESTSGEDLADLFAAHVDRPGAATLEISVSTVQAVNGGSYEVHGFLEQAQAEAPLALDVPLVVQTAGSAAWNVVHSDARRTPFTVTTKERPLAVHVDPSFDLFRLLDPREIAPSIGQLFGDPRPLVVLPAGAPEAERAAYRRLVEAWRSESHQPEIRSDAELPAVPRDRAVWLLGRGNRLAAAAFAPAADFSLSGARGVIDGQELPIARHAVVVVRRNPGDPARAMGWLFADGTAALPGLARKLPHYGKYSYLGFEGDEPTNVLKGQWATGDSPLRVDLRPAAERASALPLLARAARKALAELPAVFSDRALAAHVAWLAAPEREGRGVGSKGLEDAAEYVAAAFKAAGLAPGGDDGTYLQAFTSGRSPGGGPAKLRNVVGVLSGSKPGWSGQSALLTAHYDHLGLGWPDVHAGDEGRVHPGADDNASGVAVLIEMAKALAAGERPQRTIVFVAFSGEEAGRLGSRHYVGRPAFPIAETIGVINLDTVGRMAGNRVTVLGVGTAAEWPHIFRGAGFVTGLEPRLVAGAADASDQKSFIDAGVPAVQIFTEPHADYHRPGDTADKVDPAGLVKLAAFVKEAIAYLGEREQPLTVTVGAPGDPGAAGARSTTGAPGAGTPSKTGGRRVSFGTLPDFAFEGPGVRAAGVTPGSPAERAGVQAGDVLLSIDGRGVNDLAGFSGILRSLSPGQTVKVRLRRGGLEQEIAVTLVER